MSEHTQAQVAALDRTTSDILLQIRAVDTHLANGYPHLPAIVKPVPLSVSDVQKRLSGETQFLEYWLGEEQSWLFAVTQDHFTVHKLPPRKAIENLARLFYTSLTARTSIEGTLPDFAATVLSQRDSAAESTGRLLGVTLLGNVASLFMGRRIVVVRDGALHYVPFAALALTRMQNTRYRPLIAEHEIVELPSASVLKVLRSRRRSSPMSADIAVFADPVFDRRDERVTDEGLHGLRDSSGADQATGDGGLIIRDSVHPELSGLVFSMVNKSGAPQNGFLNLEEIYKLDLQADLVVLSACETGLGKNIRGEGLVGLTQGFLSARAQSVIATSWKVSDYATLC